MKKPTTLIVSHLSFEIAWRRFEMLENWRELAIRPTSTKDLRPNEMYLLEHENDDCCMLRHLCELARQDVNRNSPFLRGDYEEYLVARPSTIPESGMGLFYEPPKCHLDCKNESTLIQKDSILCYYYGHLHNFHSAKQLKDKTYLLCVRDDILVDPGPLFHIKARYINDPLNEEYVNCQYKPERFWSVVVATKTIHPGEELFVSYGDAYWNQQTIIGRLKV